MQKELSTKFHLCNLLNPYVKCFCVLFKIQLRSNIPYSILNSYQYAYQSLSDEKIYRFVYMVLFKYEIRRI